MTNAYDHLFDDDNSTDDLALVAGRRWTPHTQVADWVSMSAVKPGAKSLYTILCLHLFVHGGNGICQPNKEALAIMLGRLSKGSAIDTYLKDLVKLGAVTIRQVTSASGTRRNVYAVHQTPPDGYTGPVTIKEFYEQFGAEAKRRNQAQRQRLRDYRQARKQSADAPSGPNGDGGSIPAPSEPEQDQTVHPDLGVRGADQGVHPDSVVRAHPDPEVRVHPDSACKQELPEQELLEEEQNPSPPRSGSLTAVTRARTSRAASQRDRDVSPLFSEHVQAVVAALPHELVAQLPRGRVTYAARKLIVAQLRNRTVGELQARISRRWVGTLDRPGFVVHETLRRPVAVLLTLLASGSCPDVRCEDGVIYGADGARMRDCVEQACQLGGPARPGRIPEPQPAADALPPSHPDLFEQGAIVRPFPTASPPPAEAQALLEAFRQRQATRARQRKVA